MKTGRFLFVASLAGSAMTLSALSASAQNLLTNGDLEAIAAIPGWTLNESLVGMPDAIVNSAELNTEFTGIWDDLDPSNTSGLWLRAFAGGATGADAELLQIVPGSAGETYTLTGWSSFELNYTGGVEFLDPAAPAAMGMANVESPTDTRIELAFLNASGDVIESVDTGDLRSIHPEPADRVFRQSMLTHLAPAGTESIRVRALGTDMLDAGINPQSAFYDRFSLTAQSSPDELLENGDLLPQEMAEFNGWTVSELPAGTDNLRNQGLFSNNPSTGGQVGGWWRAFLGGDATISQTVVGVEGGEYTFSAFSAWGHNFINDVSETFMEIAFLDDQEQIIGDPERIDLLDEGQMNAPLNESIANQPDAWEQFSVSATAPTGTASVRVTAGILGMVDNPAMGEDSAFFDDFVLTLAAAGVPGDYSENGIVDIADFTKWRDNTGATIALPNEGAGITPGMVTQEDFSFWKQSFGNSGSASGNLLVSGTGVVPEPSTYGMSITLLLGLGFASRRLRRSQPA